ncbi:MAG TPA: class II aldolase/adducin family protein [Firmicutes bacterium]|nr:class II aldolase/adducin family protein [Bacillota bacterium]
MEIINSNQTYTEMVNEMRKLLADTMHRMYEHGFVVAAEGNISVRLLNNQVLITPSGLDKATVSPEDMVRIDLDGNVIEGNHKPSSELHMHLAAYKLRPDVNAVVHGHPPFSTGFAAAHISLPSSILPEVTALLGDIPVVEYGTPSCEELAKKVEPYLPSYDCFLLENHGVLTLGKNLQHAFHRLEILENSAKVTLIARLLGGEKLLPQAEVEKLRKKSQ